MIHGDKDDSDMPTCEVRFNDLSVSVMSSADGGDSTPTVGKFFMGIACCICKAVKAPKPVEKRIIKGCSGVFKPGTMTLLLGPPGAGKVSGGSSKGLLF